MINKLIWAHPIIFILSLTNKDMKRTKKRTIIIYIIWIAIWTLIFQFLLKAYLDNTIVILSFLLITFIFLTKDYIDISAKNKNWPFQKYWDHAPISFMITIYYYNVFNPIILFSILDTVINVWYDFKIAK